MKNTEKGFALPLALLLLVVMTLMGLTLVSITSGDIKANSEKDYSQQAFYAAESGITHAKKWMKTNTNNLTGSSQRNLNNDLKFCKTFCSLTSTMDFPKLIVYAKCTLKTPCLFLSSQTESTEINSSQIPAA